MKTSGSPAGELGGGIRWILCSGERGPKRPTITAPTATKFRPDQAVTFTATATEANNLALLLDDLDELDGAAVL